MVGSYDLVVIGTGVAASPIARECRAAGWRVAVVDSRPFGGTCALRGCTPKKVLAHAAAVIDSVARLRGKGIAGEGAHIDWAELIAFKRSFTDPVPERNERSFDEQGIDSFHGAARFVGPRSVRVGDDVLEARRIVVASGAEPVTLPIDGTQHLSTSDDFLELDALPDRIIFVGGGYIAFEFAHLAARAGAQATILHRGDQPLERFDPDLVGLLVERTRAIGVDLRVKHEVKRVEKTPRGVIVHADGTEGEQRFEADFAVHSAGRAPQLDRLDLAAGEVVRDGRGPKLNDYLQSMSNDAVYFAGDVTGRGAPLTPVASLDADVVTANLLQGNHVKPDYTGTPSVVFTSPPIAGVGYLEAQARAAGLRFRVNHRPTPDYFSARHVGETCSGHKVLIETETDRILGAHLVGPEAGEVINLFAIAIRTGLPARDLKRAILAFPTVSNDIQSMV
ncbi:dihydrolipoyl dehydrogenase family protein [Rhodospirillaceae bacterium SYSU D60014]|uniref:dihydrolipoyl dehydrogenase family protein n=1 Tax=Virgifigura deserti TaxID=2268457 RepID=UPI000E67317B